MGTFITIVLAVIIFGVGLTLFFRAIKREAVSGICAGCSGCGPDKSCANKKIVNLQKFDDEA